MVPTEASQRHGDEEPGGTWLLLIDDSRLIAGLLTTRLERIPGVRVATAGSLARARELLARHPHRFALALADLVLPDAPDGEAIDLVTRAGVPAVVLSASFSPSVRETQLGKQRVVDYLLKDSPASIELAARLVERLLRNRDIQVLVVDDSALMRSHTARLLASHRYQVLQAGDGAQALEVLRAEPGIRLVVTDFHMPGMDGVELVKEIRKLRSREQVAVIGVSSSSQHLMSAQFIKSGANDFLTKPFLDEEFFCRVTHSVEMLECIDALRDASVRDFLTGLHNRRHLFDTGETLFASARRGHLRLAAAMIDIDLFKRINDTHGHDAGDAVIRNVAQRLRRRLRKTDVVARIGGEEFCVLAVNLDPDAAPRVFEALRADIEASPVVLGDRTIHATVSIGVCLEPHESLHACVNRADELLYRAKAGGRNRVVLAGAYDAQAAPGPRGPDRAPATSDTTP